MTRRLPTIVLSCALALSTPGALIADTSITIDFAADRAFPDDAKKKREFGKTIEFKKSGVVVVASGENEFGGAVEVSRRGPGGLGVKGNGDRNAAGDGTTSGNRVNNGETLILHFLDNSGDPAKAKLKAVVFDRIVTDTENFPDAGATGYQLLVDGKVIDQGMFTLDPGEVKGGPVEVTIDSNIEISELRITNNEPFHPIANRFRIGGITLGTL